MIVKLLGKEDEAVFLESLKKYGTLYAPVKQGQSFVFAEIEDVKDVVSNYDSTILPPKKYFFPPKDTIFTFSKEGGYKYDNEALKKKQVIYALHSCDIDGLLILDRVFAGDYKDPYYLERRANSIIVGMSCEPSETCFCRSVSSHYVEKGYDLFLTDLGDKYFVMINTPAGDNIVSENAAIFKDVDDAAVEAFKAYSNQQRSKFKSSIHITELPEIMDLEYNSETWDKLGEKCLGCGTCSLVCPTCYCFNILDHTDLTGQKGERVRTWDSCLLQDFGAVSGGHDFRPGRSSRIKLRYYHKHRGFFDHYGRPSCVGCGRCTRACPAKIDPVEVIDTLRSNA
jgi:sulfhydrogenase subunit beta (sulfur reductase)